MLQVAAAELLPLLCYVACGVQPALLALYVTKLELHFQSFFSTLQRLALVQKAVASISTAAVLATPFEDSRDRPGHVSARTARQLRQHSYRMPSMLPSQRA